MGTRKHHDPRQGETPLEFAIRLWDTAEPPLTVSEAARLAGIRPQTLSKSLARREYYATQRCPHCHQLPGRPRDNYGRQLLAQAEAQRAQAETHTPPSTSDDSAGASPP